MNTKSTISLCAALASCGSPFLPAGSYEAQPQSLSTDCDAGAFQQPMSWVVRRNGSLVQLDVSPHGARLSGSDYAGGVQVTGESTGGSLGTARWDLLIGEGSGGVLLGQLLLYAAPEADTQCEAHVDLAVTRVGP